MRRKGDEIRGDEGAGNPCLPNSTPDRMVTITNRDSETGSKDRRGGMGQRIQGDERETGDSSEKKRMRLIARCRGPGGARMRGLANAASRVGTMVAGIGDGGNLVNGEDPFVLSSRTTTTLGKPSGVDPRVLVSLTGGKSKSPLEGIKRVEDPSADIETMGVTKYLDKISNGVEVPDSQPVSGP